MGWLERNGLHRNLQEVHQTLLQYHWATGTLEAFLKEHGLVLGAPYQRFSWDRSHVVWVASLPESSGPRPTPMNEVAGRGWGFIGIGGCSQTPEALLRPWLAEQLEAKRGLLAETLGALRFIRTSGALSDF